MYMLCPEYKTCQHNNCPHRVIHKQRTSCFIACEHSDKYCVMTTLQTKEDIALYVLTHPEVQCEEGL